jgi:hypothetical protein
VSEVERWMDHLLLRDESTDRDFERDVILRILEHDLKTYDRRNDARCMKQVSPEKMLNGLQMFMWSRTVHIQSSGTWKMSEAICGMILQ